MDSQGKSQALQKKKVTHQTMNKWTLKDFNQRNLITKKLMIKSTENFKN